MSKSAAAVAAAVVRRPAFPLFGLWVVLAVTSSGLQFAAGDPVEAALTPALVVLAGVGALLMHRRPGNPVGTILLTLALLITASSVASGLYLGAEGDRDPTTIVAFLVWFDEWVIFLWFGLVAILLPLLFPDGRLPSPRWRPLLWAGGLAVAAEVAGTAFGTPSYDWGETSSIANPVALGGTAGDVLETVGQMGDLAFVPVLLGTLAATAVRFRRSSGVERQQLKWFAYAIGLLLTGLAAAAVSETVGYEPLGNLGWTVFLASLIFGLPVAIGIAILRHRLYDIDVVIKRTLVYGSLTATLLATYLLMVLLFRLAVSPVTGESDLAVAGSTLTVAALFRPVRARIQAVVDRRFYRARYDAARTVESFAGRLRDELDLETLDVDLRRVVTDTVAPAHVTLWLRGPT